MEELGIKIDSSGAGPRLECSHTGPAPARSSSKQPGGILLAATRRSSSPDEVLFTRLFTVPKIKGHFDHLHPRHQTAQKHLKHMDCQAILAVCESHLKTVAWARHGIGLQTTCSHDKDGSWVIATSWHSPIPCQHRQFAASCKERATTPVNLHTVG